MSHVQSHPDKGAKRTGRGPAIRARRARPTSLASARTCIGCRCLDERDNLLRLVATPSNKIAFDLAGGSFGRGAWVHPRMECLTKSVRGLSHALRATIVITIPEIHQNLVAAAWRRAESLSRAAQRAGLLTTGAEAGANVWKAGKVAVAIVAEDARAAAVVPWVCEAQIAGRIIVGPKKSVLGRWWGQEQVAVAAITDTGLAKAIARAIAIAQIPDPTPSSREAERGTEVG
jgi:predicted RNA-binding protein YlxR (DUF448 family)